jgi:hypothetical protein
MFVLANGAVEPALTALTSTGKRSIVSFCWAARFKEDRIQSEKTILFIFMIFLK